MIANQPRICLIVDGAAIGRMKRSAPSPKDLLDFASVEGIVHQAVIFVDVLMIPSFRNPWHRAGFHVIEVPRAFIPDRMESGVSLIREHVTTFVRQLSAFAEETGFAIILVTGDARYRPLINELIQRKIRTSVFLTHPDLDDTEIFKHVNSRLLYMDGAQAIMRRTSKIESRPASIVDIVSARDLRTTPDAIANMPVQNFFQWYVRAYQRSEEADLLFALEICDPQVSVLFATDILNRLRSAPMQDAEIRRLAWHGNVGETVLYEVLDALTTERIIVNQNGTYSLTLEEDADRPTLSLAGIECLARGLLDEEEGVEG